MTTTARLLLAASMAVGLAGCGLPRSGPFYSEITSTEEAPLPFNVVEVTPQVVAATTIDGSMARMQSRNRSSRSKPRVR